MEPTKPGGAKLSKVEAVNKITRNLCGTTRRPQRRHEVLGEVLLRLTGHRGIVWQAASAIAMLLSLVGSLGIAPRRVSDAHPKSNSLAETCCALALLR